MLCSYPFKQITIRDWDGDKVKWFHPCCNMSRPDWEDPMEWEETDLTPEEAFNSKQFKELREALSNNKKHPFCKTCWDMEERGIESFRIHNDDTIPRGKLDVVDFIFSNKCNLACRMCDPQTSHRLMLDYEFFSKAGLLHEVEESTSGKFRGRITIPKTSNSKQFLWLLNNPLKELRFSGGEPFFDAQVIKLLDKYIDKGWAQNTILAYHTNGTMFNPTLINKLNKFKKQYPKLSIDAVEECYEYIRHPQSFDELDRTIRLFLKTSTNLGRINVAVVVSALNILDLHEHWQWCCSLPKKVYISYCEVYPVDRGISPIHLSRQLLENVPRIDSKKFNQIRNSYFKRNSENKSKILKEITLFDYSRNQKFQDYLHPHLTQWLTK
jgi:MoaA/NifB/PqqE/SkfB family radical SAM enzyme|tara:strand:+ start:20595 stop:21740 length:1146 start_codon:yes stop_codon:yes gene_type:complete